jgi:hypothetical protein
MSKPNLLTEIRNVRVERILDSKQNRFLTKPWVRRTLSIVAIISSYVVLASLLIPTPYIRSKTNQIYPDSDLIQGNWIYDLRDTAQGFGMLLAIWSFILLRISMRRVTLLPDQYLDELQITNRDWAFKTGYLVVRRIGLLVAAVFGFLAISFNSLVSMWLDYHTTKKTFNSIEKYISDLSAEDPFGFYFKAFLLLAFVAYSFPVILLAWREARFPESIPEVEETKEPNDKQSSSKFYFGVLKWILISFSLFASLYVSPKVFMTVGLLFYYGLITPMVYLVIPGSLFLFIWASVTAARGVIESRKSGSRSAEQKRWANITTGFLTITLLLGMVVGGAMLALVSGVANELRYSGLLPLALLAGFLMIPAQAASMAFYAKLESK